MMDWAKLLWKKSCNTGRHVSVFVVPLFLPAYSLAGFRSQRDSELLDAFPSGGAGFRNQWGAYNVNDQNWIVRTGQEESHSQFGVKLVDWQKPATNIPQGSHMGKLFQRAQVPWKGSPVCYSCGFYQMNEQEGTTTHRHVWEYFIEGMSNSATMGTWKHPSLSLQSMLALSLGVKELEGNWRGGGEHVGSKFCGNLGVYRRQEAVGGSANLTD